MKKFNTQTQNIYKNEELNQGGFGLFSNSNYQVFLLLISRIGGVDKQGVPLPPENLQREHILKASELKDIFYVDQKNTYRMLKKACDKLMGKTLRIENRKLKKTILINVCSRAEYQEKEGEITIKFTDDIMPYLAQVKERFTLYNIREISCFNSIYTTRLYELIQDFKETGWMLKSIDQLRHSFSSENKFNQYGSFKKRTFAPACAEINQIHNLNLKFEEIKDGKKVTAIRFTFNTTTILKSVNPQTEHKKNVYIKPEQLAFSKKKELRKNNKGSSDEQSSSKNRIKKKNIQNKKGRIGHLFSKLFG